MPVDCRTCELSQFNSCSDGGHPACPIHMHLLRQGIDESYPIRDTSKINSYPSSSRIPLRGLLLGFGTAVRAKRSLLVVPGRCPPLQRQPFGGRFLSSIQYSFCAVSVAVPPFFFHAPIVNQRSAWLTALLFQYYPSVAWFERGVSVHRTSAEFSTAMLACVVLLLIIMPQCTRPLLCTIWISYLRVHRKPTIDRGPCKNST